MRHRGDGELIGISQALLELKQGIDQAAQSDAKVLITGESGVGKELVARGLHAGSRRAERPFVPVNCAGLTETLLESELFGHVKGSFTGANRDKPGKLAEANQGTMFLDEIGEMSPRMQGLLLRFLETGELQRIGSDRGVLQTDVRVITATNRNLRELVASGTFREDLFYRINVIHLAVTSLRDRREDIPLLIEHFLSAFARASGRAVRTVAPDALEMLCAYAWPGNVRELENVIERLVIMGRGPCVGVADLPPDIRTLNGCRVRPKQDRRRSVADDLFKQLTEDKVSFWTAVSPLYIQRDITSDTVRELVRMGLSAGRGNYKVAALLFNIEPLHYKRFLNFLRKHGCHVPFRDYR